MAHFWGDIMVESRGVARLNFRKIFISMMCWVTGAAMMSGAAMAQIAPPGFSQVFSPDTIGPGSTSTLTYTIDNSGSASPATSLDFSNTLPASVTLASPANPSFTCAGGTLTAMDGGTTVTYTDGAVAPLDSCTVSVDVTSSTIGTHMNVSGDLTSSLGNSGTSTDDLMVVPTLPGFSKSFSPSTVAFGGASTLTYTIDNMANMSRIGNLDFTDSFPVGIQIASPANASTDCISPSAPNTTLTAPAGGSSVILDANGSTILPGFEVLDAGATCTVTVDVIGSALGTHVSTTSDLLADFVSAGTATDTLTVTGTPLILTKSFIGDPVLPGATVDLEFTILNNNRTSSATMITFTDDLDATLSGLAPSGALPGSPCGAGSSLGFAGGVLTLSGGNLPAEGSCTFSTTLDVPAAAATGAYVNTTSGITADIGGSMTMGAPASDTLNIEAAQPQLSKSFTDDPVAPGDTVNLEFTITNPSAAGTLTDLAFTDLLTSYLPFPVSATLPAPGFCGPGSTMALVVPTTDTHELSMTGGELAPSASCTFSVGIDVPVGVSAGTYVNTTSDITGTFGGNPVSGPAASDTLTVGGGANIEFRKEFTDDPVLPGATGNLQFTLTSLPESTAAATALAFSDDLNAALAGLTFSSLTGNSCGGTIMGVGTTTMSLSGASLAAGANCAIDIAVDVPPGAAPGTYTNTTSDLTGTASGIGLTVPPASDDLVVGGGLSWTKEFLTNPVNPGDTTDLEFIITNASTTTDATITFFTDNLQADLTGLTATGAPTTNTCGGTLIGTTFLTYTGGSVPMGTSCNITVPVLVPAAAAPGSYNNITSALSANLGGAVTIPAASDVLEVQSAGLGLTLTKDFTDDPVEAGSSATLEFTIDNTGADDATMMSFTDDLDAMLTGAAATGTPIAACGGTLSGTSLLTLSGASLIGGGSCTFSVAVDIPAGAAAGPYTNVTSDLAATVNGLGTTAIGATAELLVSLGSATFTKAFTDDPAAPGGTANLEFSITNTGTGALSDLRFSDDLDAALSGLVATGLPANDICGTGSQLSGTSQLTLTDGNLGVGGSCTFNVAVQIPAAAPSGGYVNTTSDLTSVGAVIATPASDTLDIEAPPTFTKAFSPDAIIAGTVSTLTFTIDNSVASIDAMALDFTDVFPAGLVVATPPNASTTCTGGVVTALAGSGTVSYTGGTAAASSSCTVSVDTTTTIGGAYANTTGDLTSSLGNSGTASDTLTVTASADVSVTKTDGVTSVVPGGTVIYTIVAANAGPSDDPAVSLTDTFPADLTCTYTSVAAGGLTGNTGAGAGDISDTLSMPAGSSATYTATCTVDTGATGTLSNTATVTPSVSDPVPGNNSATDADTDIIPTADLSVSQIDSMDPVLPGASLTYTAEVGNTGPNDATNTVATITLPAGVTLVSTSGCAEDPNGVPTCSLGTLTAGSRVNFSVNVTVDLGTTADLTNTISVAGDQFDPDTSNNSAVETTTLNEAPTADAGGPDHPIVSEGTVVQLDGSGSSDPDMDPLTFMWTQTSGPAVTISDPTLESPTFTAPTLATNILETLVFSLVVNDGAVNSAPSTISIRVSNDNETPIADAGPDQSGIDEATLVTLDGTGSSDPDMDPIFFAWEQTAGTPVTLSDIQAASPTFTAPTLNTNTPEILTFSLVVNDGAFQSVADTVNIEIVNINEAPVADAGPDQASVNEATLVTLDGSASSDPENDPLTFAWTQTGGTAVTLSDATASGPTFTAPALTSNAPETLTFSLIVNDGLLDSVADTVDITINNINETPVADAGADQPGVVEATLVNLDGTASSDPDGDMLTYPWTQPGGTAVPLSDATAAAPSFTAPDLASNTPEVLTFSLIVNDGLLDSVADTVDVTVSNVNEAPLADAGPDQANVDEATLVNLDGSGSSDPDGDAITFAWTQTGGTAVTLSDATAASPSFTAPTLATNTPETLTFSLIVNDGLLSSVADTVDVTIININGAPLADAGPDQPLIDEATMVTLDGSGSSDPDGDMLTFAWTQTGGTTVTLSDATASGPTFTAPTLPTNTPEVLTFSLIVNDGFVSSVADTVDITVNNINTAPIADAGPDQGAVPGATLVSLDGTGSSDPDGDALTFAWTQTGGTVVTLSDATSSAPTFTAPELTSTETLTFSLIVNDSFVDSPADTVDITVLENVAPTVAISGLPTITNAPFTATFTFSEPVSGFDVSDIVLGNASASDFDGAGTVFTALITPAADGTVTIDVPADAAEDSSGNGNIAADRATTNYDATAPSVAIAPLPDDVRGPFTVTVTFNEDVTGFDLSDVVITNGTGSAFAPVNGSIYSFTVTPGSQGTVTIEVPANVAEDAAGNGNTAATPVSTEYIDEDYVRTRTLAIINNFLARRADQITLNDPDLSNRLRETGSNGRLNGYAERHRANLSFKAKVSGEDANLWKLVGADHAAKVNLWTEASLVSIHQDTADSDLALVFAGIDYRVGEDTLIGLMGQYDWADEEDETQNFEISGTGWMVGPYMVTKLTDSLIFDGRAAWGRSNNDVSPFGTYTDEFKTSRWLLKGQFTGEFDWDDWRVNPNLSVIYFEEDQKAYVDSLNIAIPSQTINLGRVTFGPRFSKTFKQGINSTITPSLGIRGIWDFESAEVLDLTSGLPTGTDQFRARIEPGITIGLDGGTRLILDGFYDGLGADDYEAYGGKVGVSFPIQ